MLPVAIAVEHPPDWWSEAARCLPAVHGAVLAASRVRDMPLTDTEAEWWSRYEMLRRARGFVTVHGVTRGNPEMRVGSRLNLDRVGSPFNGPGYYVVEVSHSYDLARGYRTTFSAERGAIEVNS